MVNDVRYFVSQTQTFYVIFWETTVVSITEDHNYFADNNVSLIYVYESDDVTQKYPCLR